MLDINPFTPSGFFYLKYLDRFIIKRRVVWLVFIITMFYRNSDNTNSVDPDQTPRYAASDLSQYCLPMPLLWDARLKRVKNIITFPSKDVHTK